MSNPAMTNKRLLGSFLASFSAREESDGAILAAHAHDDCVWKVFHPFNHMSGNDAALRDFFEPLRAAFPDYEHRTAFVLAGEYEGRQMVSSWGVVQGTFDAPLVGIPPTRGLATLRFGVAATVTDGKLGKVHILLDLLDLMVQAGVYPLRRMPGSAMAWPFPPCDTGATIAAVDSEMGAGTLEIVREMQTALPKPSEIRGLATKPGKHSHHWHQDMNWYGPAGIGSARGLRGFRDFHGALFLQAFPDRTGYPREDGWDEEQPGHYIRLGDGLYAVTGGWPSLHATHLGPEWLGLPPTGRHVEMRVADWYRLTDDGKITDNWVMIDVPHILQQMGLDIFHDLQFVVDPSTQRLPVIVD